MALGVLVWVSQKSRVNEQSSQAASQLYKIDAFLGRQLPFDSLFTQDSWLPTKAPHVSALSCDDLDLATDH